VGRADMRRTLATDSYGVNAERPMSSGRFPVIPAPVKSLEISKPFQPL
jgi:hypothetical protein